MDQLIKLNLAIDTLEEKINSFTTTTSYKELKEDDQLEAIDKAKLEINLAYTVHNLIWIYLKLNGIECSNHPVMLELERLKGYFIKLGSQESNTRRQIDKAAASRFILSAIGKDSKEKKSISSGPQHTRFKEVNNDESGIPIVVEEEEEQDEPEVLSNKDEKKVVVEAEGGGGGGRKLQEVEESVNCRSKRIKFDPFEGYEKEPTSNSRRK